MCKYMIGIQPLIKLFMLLKLYASRKTTLKTNVQCLTVAMRRHNLSKVVTSNKASEMALFHWTFN